MRNSRSAAGNLLDSDAVLIQFDNKSRYCIYFRTNTLGKCMKHLIPSSLRLIALLPFFYKDSLGIK